MIVLRRGRTSQTLRRTKKGKKRRRMATLSILNWISSLLLLLLLLLSKFTSLHSSLLVIRYKLYLLWLSLFVSLWFCIFMESVVLDSTH